MSFSDYLKENNLASPLSSNGMNFGYTTVDEGVNEPPHKHQLKVDRQGNGITSENGMGVHTHMIVNGMIHYANGHQHSIDSGSLRPDDREFRSGDQNGQVIR